MKRLLFVLALAGVVSCAEKPTKMTSDLDAYFDAVSSQYMGSVAVRRDGNTTYQGREDIQGQFGCGLFHVGPDDAVCFGYLGGLDGFVLRQAGQELTFGRNAGN